MYYTHKFVPYPFKGLISNATRLFVKINTSYLNAFWSVYMTEATLNVNINVNIYLIPLKLHMWMYDRMKIMYT